MLERASISERIRSVISLLKRYESLFRLPTRIRQQTERQEFDQVRALAGQLEVEAMFGFDAFMFLTH